MPETFGEAIARLRVDRGGGLSLRALARAAHIDPGHLSRLESGQRQPTRGTAAALDEALSADGQLIALAHGHGAGVWSLRGHWRAGDADELAAALLGETPGPGNALRLAHEWMITEPPQSYALRAGRRIGASVVEDIEQRAEKLRRLDDHMGGGDTFRLATGELAATASLLREASCTQAVLRRLLGAVSEMCQIVGWVTSDAGLHSEAHRTYLTGVVAGHAAGNKPAAANCLSSLAYQVSNIGDPHTAVTLARSALRGADGASATTRALLAERVAWAHARAGQAQECARTLDGVEDAFTDREPTEDPPWTYWLSAEEIQVMAGRCWTELRRPLRAVPILEQATTGYDDDTPRETALYLTWLAEALLQAGEVEQAADAATRAMRMAKATRSARTADRVEMLRRSLNPYCGLAAVDILYDDE